MSIFKPRNVDKISPLHELYDDFKNKKIVLCFVVFINFIIATGLSGYIQFTLQRIQEYSFLSNRKTKKLTVAECFYLGIKGNILLTIILAVLLLFVSYRLFRALKRNYLKNYKDNYLKAKSETYGGAHFQTTEELAENHNLYNSIEDTTDDILGINEDGKLVGLRWGPGTNRNMLFVGGPGCGKTSSQIKTMLYQGLRRGISMVVTDTKGDLYKETSAVVRECGYIVKILNLKPDQFRNSDAVNLFHNLDPEDPCIDVQADIITNILFKNLSGDEKIDYWYKNEYNLVKMVIMIIVTNPVYIKQGRNKLPEVYNFLTENSVDEIAAIAGSYPKDSVIYKCYSTFADANENVQAQILNGAKIRLQKLANRVLQNVLSYDEIDTVVPMKRKCVYYVVIPDQDNSFRFISSLFFSTMFIDQCNYSDSLNREEKKKQLPVRYLLDEYKNTGGIEGLATKISVVRSRKIELVFILQDISQLDAMYEEADAKTIKSCCSVKAILSTDDQDTAQEFSDMFGQQTVMTESQRFVENTDDIVHARNQAQITRSENQRPLVMPQEFMNSKFAADDVCYKIKGQEPIRVKKYFSELAGKAIHPLEAEGMKLGEKKTGNHKPKWRYELEIEEQKREQELADILKDQYGEEETVIETFEEELPKSRMRVLNFTEKADEAGKRRSMADNSLNPVEDMRDKKKQREEMNMLISEAAKEYQVQNTEHTIIEETTKEDIPKLVESDNTFQISQKKGKPGKKRTNSPEMLELQGFLEEF